jgi:hypothetical protein
MHDKANLWNGVFKNISPPYPAFFGNKILVKALKISLGQMALFLYSKISALGMKAPIRVILIIVMVL